MQDQGLKNALQALSRAAAGIPLLSICHPNVILPPEGNISSIADRVLKN